MKIDLSTIDVFEDQELELNKNVTFIFGKNGTGKSTLANQIKKMELKYDVAVFQGFNNIIDENKKLNGIVLGTENSEISKAIEAKRLLIEEIVSEIDTIKSTLLNPNGEDVSNFWTRKNYAEEAYNTMYNEIESICTTIASNIKRMDNPRISEPSYNKTKLKTEIDKADELNEVEIDELIKTVNTETRIAAKINFPDFDVISLTERVNNLLKNFVREKITLKRLDNSEKKNFAEDGLKLHKKGDICVFCGNRIKDEDYDQLKAYFSADEVREFREDIKNCKKKVLEFLQSIQNINISIDNFYPSFQNKIEKLVDRTTIIKERNIKLLKDLLEVLDDKLKNLFEESKTINIEIPEDFTDIESEYNSLVEENNKNNVDDNKRIARDRLRFHYIKKYLDKNEYYEKKAKLDVILKEKEKRIKEYEDEKAKIFGTGGLNEEKSKIESEIRDLQNKTKSEAILADKINTKLKYMVSFQLEHVDTSDSKGFYLVKNPITGECRDITLLSTGEKNIIAFLYFIEKLDEIKNEETNKIKIIVFDDPMNSNDDGMQYLIIEELQSLMKKIRRNNDYFVLLTHNKHFYINVKYSAKYNNNSFFRLESNGYKSIIKPILKEENDFKTSYDALWQELYYLYDCSEVPADMLLNPIRRIIETFTNFNGLRKVDFLEKVTGSKKLFDVNSHSIDDLEAELNGKNKDEIMKMLFNLFKENNFIDHFKIHCKFYNSKF